MANMSYCRFENTSRDLSDCLENIDASLSESEHRARKRLIRQCARILESLGVSVAYQQVSEAQETTEDFQ